MTDIATVLAPFPHPLSFPAYAAVKAAHEAGEVTPAEWAAYDELIHTDGGSWLGFMRWNRNGGAMPEERIDNHLTEIDDAAADYAPEAGPANNPGECPICGHALEIDADGWFICDACEMAWQERPAQTYEEMN